MAVSVIPNMQGNKVLWNGAPTYMGSASNISLSEPISEQRTGIVLMWSAYENGSARNYDFEYHFIPKNMLGMSEVGANFPLGTANFSKVGCKYLYISDDHIRGYSNNDTTGSGSGNNYANNYWALRAVFGV